MYRYYTIQAVNNKGDDQTAWSWMFAYGINRFSHDVAYMLVGLLSPFDYFFLHLLRFREGSLSLLFCMCRLFWVSELMGEKHGLIYSVTSNT